MFVTFTSRCLWHSTKFDVTYFGRLLVHIYICWTRSVRQKVSKTISWTSPWWTICLIMNPDQENIVDLSSMQNITVSKYLDHLIVIHLTNTFPQEIDPFKSDNIFIPINIKNWHWTCIHVEMRHKRYFQTSLFPLFLLASSFSSLLPPLFQDCVLWLVWWQWFCTIS